jgi:thymidylate synthase
MLQEMMARRLGVELGEYIHMVGSFHLYDGDVHKAARYVAEGHHRLAEMPPMPPGDPFPLVPDLLDVEERIRRRERPDDAIAALDPYWGDLLRLLEVRFASDDNARLDEISSAFREPTYRTYLEDRRGRPVSLSMGVADASSITKASNT